MGTAETNGGLGDDKGGYGHGVGGSGTRAPCRVPATGAPPSATERGAAEMETAETDEGLGDGGGGIHSSTTVATQALYLDKGKQKKTTHRGKRGGRVSHSATTPDIRTSYIGKGYCLTPFGHCRTPALLSPARTLIYLHCIKTEPTLTGNAPIWP